MIQHAQERTRGDNVYTAKASERLKGAIACNEVRNPGAYSGIQHMIVVRISNHTVDIGGERYDSTTPA